MLKNLPKLYAKRVLQFAKQFKTKQTEIRKRKDKTIVQKKNILTKTNQRRNN